MIISNRKICRMPIVSVPIKKARLYRDELFIDMAKKETLSSNQLFDTVEIWRIIFSSKDLTLAD